MNTPGSGRERSLGAAAVTRSAGQGFPLDVYHSRLVEPRPRVGLLTCVGGPPTAKSTDEARSGGGSQVRVLYYADGVII